MLYDKVRGAQPLQQQALAHAHPCPRAPMLAAELLTTVRKEEGRGGGGGRGEEAERRKQRRERRG